MNHDKCYDDAINRGACFDVPFEYVEDYSWTCQANPNKNDTIHKFNCNCTGQCLPLQFLIIKNGINIFWNPSHLAKKELLWNLCSFRASKCMQNWTLLVWSNGSGLLGWLSETSNQSQMHSSFSKASTSRCNERMDCFTWITPKNCEFDLVKVMHVLLEDDESYGNKPF